MNNKTIDDSSNDTVSNASNFNTVSLLDNIFTFADTPFSGDSYGIQASFGISKNILICWGFPRKYTIYYY